MVSFLYETNVLRPSKRGRGRVKGGGGERRKYNKANISVVSIGFASMSSIPQRGVGDRKQ